MQRNGGGSNAQTPSQLRGPSLSTGSTSPSLASKAALQSLQRLLIEAAAFFRGWDLRGIMRAHAFCAIALGGTTIALPHSYLGAGYSHYAHEFIRLYGCLTLAIGWIVWKSQAIKDGRLARAFSETFSLAYSLQFLVMLRAQFTNPAGHSALHWAVALAFGALGGLYGYIRWVKKIKNFALPGHGQDD